MVCDSYVLASIELCGVVLCCGSFVLPTKSQPPHSLSARQRSESASLSSSLDQSSQQAEKNKPLSV